MLINYYYHWLVLQIETRLYNISHPLQLKFEMQPEHMKHLHIPKSNKIITYDARSIRLTCEQ